MVGAVVRELASHGRAMRLEKFEVPSAVTLTGLMSVLFTLDMGYLFIIIIRGQMTLGPRTPAW